jgi:large subunit ribosomal protein L3
VLREIRGGIEGAELGKRVTVDMVFAKDEYVDVIGISKGKGFQGGVKRWHFRGGPKTHGQSDRHRAPGSVGAGTTPGRVLKGQKMAGHMGHQRVTVQNLRVVDIDPEHHLLLVQGAIPGPDNGTVVVRKAIKKAGGGR